MFPPQFGYRRAESVSEAIELLSHHADDDVRVLAGGHGLLPDVKAGRESPDVLVDVGGIDGLRYVDARADETVVGALATYADVADSERAWSRATAFAESVAHVGDVQIRNRGTVGGNLAQADPTADPPAAVLASAATVDVRGPDGEREVPAGEFFVGDGETALGDDELVTAVRVPRTDGAGGAYVKKTHPASGYALVGVAAVVAVADGVVTDARVAVNGVTDPPRRLDAVEEALVGGPADADGVASAADRAGDGIDPDAAVSDAYASGEYRVETLSPRVRRALATAVDRATGEASLPPGDGVPSVTGGGHR